MALIKDTYVINLKVYQHSINHSMNNGILKSLCSLSYMNVDIIIAVGFILNAGPRVLLVKLDVIHVFYQSTPLTAICW